MFDVEQQATTGVKLAMFCYEIFTTFSDPKGKVAIGTRHPVKCPQTAEELGSSGRWRQAEK